METDAAFPTDYFAARARFREAASRIGWNAEAHPIDAEGPGGEMLTIDIAVSPCRKPARTVIASTGLHGVEGYFGSGVQLAWLERHRPAPDLPVRLVFIHALNPYGFAWDRRYDENNVDPNRNFISNGEQYVGAPQGYAELDHVLNPPSPPSRWDPFVIRAGWEVLCRGLPAMKRIIMTGQYEFPRGVTFGGAKPSQSNLILAANLNRLVAESDEVVHLDFHCGLGPWGTHKLLIDYQPSSHQRARLEDLFGRDAIEVCDAEGTAYPTRGDFGRWCVSRGAEKNYLFACVEFGTYGPITMLAGIRAENRAHHWDKPRTSRSARARKRLKELFCPPDFAWRTKVLSDGVAMIDRAAGIMPS